MLIFMVILPDFYSEIVKRATEICVVKNESMTQDSEPLS
jgi:hypothetical protein